jgi:predicted metal-dependent hydrolase
MHPLLRFTLDLFESSPVVATPPERVKSVPLKPNAEREPHQPGRPLRELLAPAHFAHPRANRQTRLGEAVVHYEFQRSKRRTIGFSVGADGLAVRAPAWVPLVQVDAALQEKALWILKKLEASRERCEQHVSQPLQWRNGTELPYLGQPITVVLDPGHHFGAAGAELQDKRLQVALAHSAAPEQIRDVVIAWLMRQAKARFTERLDHFAPQLQVQWRKLSLSNASTRWGSARADGAIRLNWRLIHLNPTVIDYVVAHELSHLRVMNHSPHFWDTVRSVLPDYAALRGQLKDELVPKLD